MHTRSPIFRRSVHGPEPGPGLRCAASGTWIHGALRFDARPEPAALARALGMLNVTLVSEADAQPRIAAVAPEVLLTDALGEALADGGWTIAFSLDLHDVWPRPPRDALWVHLSARELCADPVRIGDVAAEVALADDALLAAHDAARAERWAAACEAFAAAFAGEPELLADLDRPHLANAARAAARAGALAQASAWLESHVKACRDRLAAIERELATNPTAARRELLAQRTAGVLARMGLGAGA